VGTAEKVFEGQRSKVKVMTKSINLQRRRHTFRRSTFSSINILSSKTPHFLILRSSI